MPSRVTYSQAMPEPEFIQTDTGNKTAQKFNFRVPGKSAAQVMTQMAEEKKSFDRASTSPRLLSIRSTQNKDRGTPSSTTEELPLKQRESSCHKVLGPATQALAEEAIRQSAESSFDIPDDLALLTESEQGIVQTLKKSGHDVS